MGLEPRLNLARERAEVGHALQFVIGKFDVKVILEPREQIRESAGCRCRAP